MLATRPFDEHCTRPVRYLYVIAGLVVVVGLLFAIKFKQISSLISFGKAAQKAGPPPEMVGTDVAQTQNWGRHRQRCR